MAAGQGVRKGNGWEKSQGLRERRERFIMGHIKLSLLSFLSPSFLYFYGCSGIDILLALVSFLLYFLFAKYMRGVHLTGNGDPRPARW